ncbi:hypothetical protein A2291_01050 [candidate division WOR-1 bacterium RIFOXYB2_FULL_42_35]|uniref:Periplasmic heavy metal sensor n=1 Tax=candidate division WOR-1 bacterium RIFOXYC2_FULL_41_25 TaxID=1802586 RepID=A0A1F4TL93_UNCSA|nr:MAG: hypothetical protein A2247_02685 [candidate division WOR-1 bacterium RIFOXYA2_FULL_41_14]OGC23024.1 MAG: hypothetical protein A2291_01050 [candidate division WOR-1 bacterium RIFOXYB2_FULL_42_35]OGC33482.1 MAG: hypothetical protein A2462_06830 [candidate division WOR-1 bacterium RIFOXYC2_FULL_41_25]OGC43639.1 MAG: hypothetical protein A2548_04340 [candidate division WOR-1 bacterium RIFOXYD2_FULL_41_8]
MKNKLVSLALFLVLSLALTTSQALAWGGGQGGPSMKRGMESKMFKTLALTKEQKERFLTERQKMAKEALESRQKNERFRLEMKAELVKDSPDKDRLHKHIREINNNSTELQIKRLDLMLEMRYQLTPEQRVKFKEMVENERKQMKKSWGKKKH